MAVLSFSIKKCYILLNMNEEEIASKAKEHARKYRMGIARKLTDTSIFIPESNPVSVFMAGSPGAGKTESSVRLIEELSSNGNGHVLRIDADEYRLFFKDQGYHGHNSHVFHGAVSLVVEKVHDLALSQSQSFIFDGTLSKFDKAVENIKRSLEKGRFVQIIYVYQEPYLAWEFTKKREEYEGRKILKADFIKAYFGSRETVNRLKERFGNKIELDLVIKDIDNTELRYEKNIQSVDPFIKNKITLQELESSLE
jgi:UDP-N-acetylglucosamine kinase